MLFDTTIVFTYNEGTVLIGVLSDSHIRVPGTRVGLSTLTAENLPPQVLFVFKGVDLILHAGDIYTVPVLDQLETVAPVLACEGDDDPFEIVNDPRVKHEQYLKIEGKTLWLSHYGPLDGQMTKDNPDIIVYGHTHDIQRHTLTKLNGNIGAWALGCLKKMYHKNNKWLKGRLHNWGHAFAIVDWFSNGEFKVEVVEIIDGKTTVWGELIDGTK